MLQLPHPPRAGPVLLTLLFHPSSFVLPSSEWFYIFFSSGQVLLSALSWCSECTSVSECVFLMYPWREMYSMSTYSSPILFSLLFQLLISKFLSILSLRFLIFLQDLHPALKGISNHLEWSTHTQPYSDIVVCAQTGGWNLKKIFFNIYLFICLCWVVAHGLWSTWAQQLQHVGLIAPRHCGDLVPQSGIKLRSLALQSRFLNTGPGKVLFSI